MPSAWTAWSSSPAGLTVCPLRLSVTSSAPITSAYSLVTQSRLLLTTVSSVMTSPQVTTRASAAGAAPIKPSVAIDKTTPTLSFMARR